MIKVLVQKRHDGLLFFERKRADGSGVNEHQLIDALSMAKFMWFEYHWPYGTMKRSMEARKIHSWEYDTPEKDGRPKAASYPKYVVFED